jgi:15-cis-phytoene synthase
MPGAIGAAIARRSPRVISPLRVRRTVAVTTTDDRLRDSYRACRRLQRRHDPTYWCATQCLPREIRPAVHALYGFVRGADEIVDGRGRRLSAGAPRRAALDAWKAELDRGLRTGTSDHPVVAALVDAGRRHRLPLHLLDRYMASMRVDCDATVRITSEAELDRYMDGSAATVGRIMAPLLGAPEDAHEDLARLGVAFQLTNFVRDVAVDWELDRIYLPDLPEDALRAGVATDALRERVAHHVRRARALFAATAPVGDVLPPRMARGVRLARGVYARVLDRVERNGHDVVGARAALAPWQGARAAAGSLLAAR